MLELFHVVPDYLGLPNRTGHQMRDTFVEQLKHVQADFRTGCRLESLNWEALSLTCNGETLHGSAWVIATGTRKRRLNVPGEAEWLNRGVHFLATRDPFLYAGKHVCVVGGGDAAKASSKIRFVPNAEVKN